MTGKQFPLPSVLSYNTEKKMKLQIDIKKVINEHDINPDTLKILENVLFEDDRVDSRLFLLIMTCWSVVNTDKYPIETLSISCKVYASLDD